MYGAAVLEGALTGMVYGLVGAGFSFSFGTANLANFAYGGLVLWGMYLAVALNKYLSLSPFLSLPVVFGAGVALAVALYRVVFRRLIDLPEELQLVGTFGLLVALVNAAQWAFRADVYGAEVDTASTSLFGLGVRQGLLASGLVALLILAGTYLWLFRTKGGKQLRAATDNVLASRIVGVDVPRVLGWTQWITFGLAAMAGALFMTFGVAYPARGFEIAVFAFVVAVLGGLGQLWGALLAGVLIGIFDSIGTLLLPTAFLPLVRAIAIIACMTVRPRGLFAGVK